MTQLKIHLKEVILENIPDISVFVKSTRKNELNRLIASSKQVNPLKIHRDSIAHETDICSLRKVAKKFVTKF